MDLKALTPEERSALTALARSPGWALLVEKLLLPQIVLATRFLDRPAAEQSGRADWLRGIKAAYMNAVEIVYHVAGITNPFMQHALGLMADIGQQQEKAIHANRPQQDEPDEPQRKAIDAFLYEANRRARSGSPV